MAKNMSDDSELIRRIVAYIKEADKEEREFIRIASQRSALPPASLEQVVDFERRVKAAYKEVFGCDMDKTPTSRMAWLDIMLDKLNTAVYRRIRVCIGEAGRLTDPRYSNEPDQAKEPAPQ